MNARTLTTLSALVLTGFTSSIATAGDSNIELAWQQPGYVEEVVVVTAPRPVTAEASESATTTTLARQQPGYVEEVVVVRVSRRDVLAAALPRMLARLEQLPAMGLPRD
ncbi:MAG: hypothetical protein PVH89_06925 [Gammaproteobacteria bacterium]|jgi:hypothetical protein